MYVVNASDIALDEMGRPIPNTPMLGALIKVSEMISLEVLLEDITAKFSKKFKKQVVEGNLRAINRAYKEVHAA
jgi:pyruvate ferredoxin oxidoreductase gamma subunit